MLKKKMFRDILQNKSQFITIFLMLLIGIMVYTGIESYMTSMTRASELFYSKNNLQDLNVLVKEFKRSDLNKIRSMKNVRSAEAKLTITGVDLDDENKTYLINFIESNNISKFYVFDGEEFDVNKKGVWVDKFYALENKLKVGDTIKIKYDTLILEEKILGLINVPDHVYDVKDDKELVPNRKTFGFVYLSVNEISKSYIDNMVMKSLNLTSQSQIKKYIKDYNYKDYIPFNYIMVDVDSKENVLNVKNNILNEINPLAVIKIEDTKSYSMYQGEIDEGKAYVGIFSSLFIFIALLSVVTTMTRIVKNQRLEIGTLKSLGYKDYKVKLHYISYGFYVSIFACIFGIILGRYIIGNIFLNMEMSFFEIPNSGAVINNKSYLVSLIVILLVSFITYLTCMKELKKSPAESLKNSLSKIKDGHVLRLNFKFLSFESKWNLRDISRNKFRTLTGIIGIVGSCTLIVCALGMLNSMNHFIKLQFEELYNFKYKLSISDMATIKDIEKLTNKYGNSTSESLLVEIKKGENIISNNIFVSDAGDLVRFKDNSDNYIKIDSADGVYVTNKFALNENYKIGDYIYWHVYGDKKYYKSKIVGLNRDPQNQNITMTREYLEKLGINYKPDSLYTNDLKGAKEIKNVELIQDIDTLKDSINQMLSMMKKMIIIIIFFAVVLGSIIIYNMSILSYNEKRYQFATLKVLGFKDKKIRKIFIEQNIILTVFSILIGLPGGYYLTSFLFKACLDDNFDFNVYIKLSTYIIALIGTILISFIVSFYVSKKINKIDMVSSLKGNE